MNYAVTIIVPVYGVEKYIEKCVVSLFEQDFESIEYVFVNDCTPDKSIAILEQVIEQYPNRKSHIKIIHHEENKGIGAARKTGILNASGEYILHIDSDDWCELDMVSSLYQKAKEDNADIVVCDFYVSTSKQDKYIKQNYTDDKVKNLQGLLNGSLHGAVWNKLIKKSLYEDNNVYPPSEIIILEDLWVSFRLMYFSKMVSYLSKSFLHYRQDNSNSLTKSLDDKKIDDLKWYVETMIDFLKKNNLWYRDKDDFLKGNLHCVLHLTAGSGYKENIQYISPESDRLIYLWQLPYLTLLKKVIYSFDLLGVGWVVRLAYYFKNNLK